MASGDGACWLQLPKALGANEASFGKTSFGEGCTALSVESIAVLPIRVTVRDPNGGPANELFRATRLPPFLDRRIPLPKEGASSYSFFHDLGENEVPGTGTIDFVPLNFGKAKTAPLEYKTHLSAQLATFDAAAVSTYFDDAKKITDLFAGKAMAPPYDKLNWDAKRVWNLDPKKFAVFGPDDAAKKIAEALKAKGMIVEVNPKYEIKPIVREPGRGGAGPTFGLDNFENINAHAIVLPGSPLLKNSFERGHINRPITATFPGPGRAYIQWGVSCYQPGWEDVFVQGDLDAGVAWLLDAINGKVDSKTVELEAKINAVEAKKTELPAKLAVSQEIKLNDTPVGVGSSPDGKTTYILLYGGEISAYGADGKQIWRTQALLEGCNLAVSPEGDRIAVAGYPGLLVLDAKDGKVLGGHRAKPYEKGEVPPANKMLAAAWNDKGTLVAAGWAVPNPKTPEAAVVLDADGKEVSRPKEAGAVMGVAFAPGTETLLIGADQLTAVNARDGKPLWTNPVKGAQTFSFTADGKTGAAGGWGKNVGVFNAADGKATKQGVFDSVVGGVAFLPSGDLAVAVWGGVHPLYVLRGNDAKPAPLFQSQFGFQNVMWSDALKGLVAAEQGGKLWMLNADGKPKAMLDVSAGTTAYRLMLHGGDIIAGRMNRIVQRVKVQ